MPHDCKPTLTKNQIKIARKKRLGLCLRCENPPRPGFQTCANCANKIKRYLKQRKRRGICRDCPRRTVVGKRKCKACLRIDADKALRKQEERKAAKICIQCGQRPVTKFLRCIECRTENSATNKRNSSRPVENIPKTRSDAHLPHEEIVYTIG